MIFSVCLRTVMCAFTPNLFAELFWKLAGIRDLSCLDPTCPQSCSADPSVLLLGAENSQVESCAGASSSESILQQELLRRYTGPQADSTRNSSASVYNNIRTITKHSRLRGERGGLQ